MYFIGELDDEEDDDKESLEEAVERSESDTPTEATGETVNTNILAILIEYFEKSVSLMRVMIKLMNMIL